MAANAAHFTTTFEAKPSIFEIIAQNSLNNTLHPAFQKVALFLATINPRKWNWLCEYYDEVFLALNGVLQFHYLQKTNASFSEYFYGLKRVPLDRDILSSSHKQLSLLFLVVLPYVKRKLSNRVQLYRLQYAEGTLQNNLEGYCKKSLLTCYSSYELIFNIWTLVQYLQYMSDQSEYQTPSLKLQNLRLIYSVESQDVVGFWTSVFRGQLSLSELSKGLVQNTLQSALELSAFFVQFLQTWNTERPNYSFSALPPVDPPPLDNKAQSLKGRCPLCLQAWKIATIIPISGYVYCFPCIIRHLREQQRCPITNLPAKPLDVIRIYDTD